MHISQEVKGVIMRNLCGTIFYIKTNVLQDFHICMSVPLSQSLHFELISETKLIHILLRCCFSFVVLVNQSFH